MAIQNLRSSSAHKRPIPNVLSAGQIAVNTNQASPGLFFKDSNGDLVKVGPVHIGTAAPNSSPATTAADALVSGTVYQILTLGTTDFTAVGASANTVGVVFTATGAGTGTGTVSGQQGNEKGEQWLDTTGGAYDLKIYDGSAWRSQAGEFVNVTGDTMTGALGVVAGSASAPGVFFSGDTNTGLLSPGADSVAITTGGTQRIVVDSSGRVGIGTTSASESLEVAGNGLKVSGQTSSVTDEGITFDWDSGSNNGRIFSESAGSSNLLFYTTSSGTRAEAMRIDSSGRVLIGTDASGFADAAHNLTIADDGNCGMTIRAGTSSSVSSIYFADGTTGGANYAGFIDYQHNGDHMRFGTNGGQERMRIDSSGRLGVGTASPAQALEVNGNIQVGDTASSVARVDFGSASTRIQHNGDDTLPIFTNGTERMRIDSSGRLLVGISSSPSAGSGQYGKLVSAGNTLDSTGDGRIILARGKDVSQLASGNDIGGVYFTDSLGNTFASIRSAVDSTAGSNDFPGRLAFATTADGASSPTERMRIDSSGNVELTTTDSSGTQQILFSDGTSGRGKLVYRHNGDSLAFETLSGERMRIDSAGNIGIGTTSPTQKLDVRGSIYVGDNITAGGTATFTGNVTSKATFLNELQSGYSATGSAYKVFSGSSTFVDILNNGTATFAGPLTVNDYGIFSRVINDGWANYFIGGFADSGGYKAFIKGNGIFIGNNLTGANDASPGNTAIALRTDGSASFGAVSKSSGSFRIDHPLKPETHQLVHSFIEGPQADNIYRGKVELVDGTATVNIDTVAGMTEGTFAALNREIQCFTTNETGWTAIKGSVTDNLLTIVAQDNTCTDTISWLVIGERQDQHMYDTEWTDENGKVIVEPEKQVEEAEEAE